MNSSATILLPVVVTTFRPTVHPPGSANPVNSTAATEASYFAREVPTVVFGPGDLADGTGPVAHADREYVQLPEVERAASVLADALTERLREG